jgi:hypothetical protein
MINNWVKYLILQIIFSEVISLKFLSFHLNNTKKNFKRKEDLNLGLDLPFSSFTIAMLDVFSIGSTGLHLWRVALNLVCRSISKSILRSNLFNLRYDRLLKPRHVFRIDVYNSVLHCCCL